MAVRPGACRQQNSMSGKLKIIFADFLRTLRQLWLEFIGGMFLAIGNSVHPVPRSRNIGNTFSSPEVGIGPFHPGPHFLRRDVLLRIGEFLEVQEVPIVSASKYKKYTDPELDRHVPEGRRHGLGSIDMRYRRLIYSVPVRFGFRRKRCVQTFFKLYASSLLEHLHEVKDDRKIRAWIDHHHDPAVYHLKAMKNREIGDRRRGRGALRSGR